MESVIEKAALLHDIGKLILRAEPQRKTHSAVGVEFLQQFVQNQALLRAVGHHHSADLRGVALPPDDISYIIYEADNLAAGTDRRKDEEAAGFGFDSGKNLDSVFNVFSGEQTAKTSFRLQGLLRDMKPQYPTEAKINATTGDYNRLLLTLRENFQKSPDDMTVNELLRVLEAVMSYVPSSTATDEIADISLYDHVKLTAAYAACMYRYFAEHGITDYKEHCYSAKVEEFREKDIFLLVSGDLSGVQNFIYNIPSKGALKSLRGRSFYLEILLEHIADELLEYCGLSRSCLLYTGGGHFYLLLPNTEAVKKALSLAEEIFNDWLLEQFGTRLYLALGWAPCHANEFNSVSGSAGAVFRRVSKILAEKKLKRYSRQQLSLLFNPESKLNRIKDSSRECSICHTSTAVLKPYLQDGENDTEACTSCQQLFRLGKAVLDASAMYVSEKEQDDCMPLPPSLDGKQRFLCYAKDKPKLDNLQDSALVRLYMKNELYTGEKLATYIWLGDYTAKDEHGRILEFEDLALLSGGTKDETGIKRLAVLRADVDNLGAAFMAGFPAQYATLSRTAALSRQLSIFFKRYINNLCAGELTAAINNGQHFSIFGEAQEGQRNVHIVYSGGDDFFLVGAWDDLIELAVDIRRAFARFTNNKLTFSAGIGFFRDKTPVYTMARLTGELESFAKAQPGKDSLALFGVNTEISGEEEAVKPQSYSWQDFTQKVCGEKIKFLLQHFAILRDGQSKTKLPLGKSAIYRWLGLMTDADEQINLARFAYTMGRMAPKEKENADNQPQWEHYRQVTAKLYEWFKQSKDRKELVTALQLLVYKIREKGE